MDPMVNYYFYNYANDIIASSYYQELDKFIQHGETTVLQHSLAVAYYSCKIGWRLRIKCDYKSLIRGALLHDFFLYDWHVKDKSHSLHGFKHSKTALKNAEKYFKLNDKERDIIKKHMWPLNINPPRYKESFIVWTADKYCALTETVGRIRKSKCKLKKLSLYNTIHREK